ncbi:MAG: flagellar basal body P-ring formation chaperone FlgA [Phycisphaerales bacterium]
MIDHTAGTRSARIARLCIAAAIVALLLLAGHALAGQIRLKGTAFANSDEPITLAMVAALEGTEAERLGETIIVADPGGAAGGSAWIEIGTDRVTEALRVGGANLGRLAISGSACIVRFLDAPRPEPVPGPREPSERESPAPVVIPANNTIRGAVALGVCGMLGVEPGELRLGYPGSDHEWLDAPRPAHRILALPRSGAGSARLLVEVRVYDDQTLLEERTIRVDALIRRTVVTLTEGIDRGQTITESSISVQSMWVEPSTLTPISDPAQAVGLIARKRLSGGAILLPDQLEQPILVKRNELVRVTAITRGVVVETEAYALSDARMGERVTLRRAGSNERFTGVVEARARVLVRLD